MKTFGYLVPIPWSGFVMPWARITSIPDLDYACFREQPCRYSRRSSWLPHNLDISNGSTTAVIRRCSRGAMRRWEEPAKNQKVKQA